MNRFCLSLIILWSILGLSGEMFGADQTRIGKQIEEFSLRDYRGKVHSLSEYAESKILVVAFLGNDCPLARLYAPRLESLAQKLKDDRAAFLAINANRQDAPTRIAAYARKHGVSFPILKDPDNQVADAFGAVRTPEVFVLDEKRVVRYHGRIDDQYLVGLKRPKVTRRDLEIAIEELAAGKPVSTPETEALGCFIGRVGKTEPHGDITYSKHIAAIFNRHCVECHRDHELAPFPLTTYEESVGWAATIREVVEDGRMPPWFADPKHGHFSNDISLSAEEKRLLFAWIDNGSPQGDPADLPEPPKFFAGWRINEPDAIYQMKKPFTVPADETVEYQYFMVDPGLKEDVWVSQAEARPDNHSVVHHMVVYAVPEEYKLMATAIIASQRLGGKLFGGRRRNQQSRDGDANDKTKNEKAKTDEPKSNDSKPDEGRRRRGRGRGRGNPFRQMVAIYAPGMVPWRYPQGTAMKVKKGSAFVIQMHYTPNGTEQKDQSYVGFKFAKAEEVKKRIRYGMAINTRFKIPPHDSNYENTASHTFERDTLLLNLFPHMHYRGKAFRFEAIYPDQTREVLLDVPRYDFYWQLRYDLTEPKLLPKGTTLHCTAHFDNSEENLINPDPSQAVGFGLQSWEEMLIGYYTVVPADEDLTQTSEDNTGE